MSLLYGRHIFLSYNRLLKYTLFILLLELLNYNLNQFLSFKSVLLAYLINVGNVSKSEPGAKKLTNMFISPQLMSCLSVLESLILNDGYVENINCTLHELTS